MSEKELIASDVLENFMAKFWGYGTFEAPIWMVGMEESCGKTDVPKRVVAWHQRGQKALEDAADYHREIGVTKLFLSGAPLQRTWSKLIKTYLAAHGWETYSAETRRFQTEILGRSDPAAIKTCLLELMPLPSPSTKKWLIKDHTNIPYLQTRAEYFSRVAPDRVRGLKNLISEFKPKVVLFYGVGYRAKWEEIAGLLSPHPQLDRLLHGTNEGTTFVALPHPVSHGVTNADFITTGKLLRMVRIQPSLTNQKKETNDCAAPLGGEV